MADYKMNMQGVQITWLGHATFKITSPQGKVILIDPWTQKNPACPAEWKKIDKVDLMLVTHGHFDHIGDAVEIAKATKPTVVTIVELAGWLQSKGVENTIGMNKGGTITIDGVKITMTHAIHTSGVEDGSYVGEACSYVLEFENQRKLYHAGDTCAFSDMQLINELHRPDVALLPIGDYYTMGPREAAVAVRMLGVLHVIPMHYGTFPALTGTPAGLREALQQLGLNEVEVIEMQPGQTI
jgi:L-ascorbate metabolism protein UlaG (beta-lactamase superfamily)